MIVVCGEALMDVFDAGATPTGQALDARLGGSPFNVALGLARLGQPVALCTAVSRGFLGQRIVRALEAEGIATSLVQHVDAPTSICIVGLDDRGVPAYDFYGDRGADRRLDLRALDALPADASACTFGSYAMVVEPVASTQRAIVERLRPNALIAYDPNVRLTVEPDLGRWTDALSWMVPRTHLLKVSEEDLERLMPGAAIDAVAARWLRAGVRLVVVTRGEHGAVGYTASGLVVRAEAARVDVVDTVGAGDTFQAALLTRLAERGALSALGLAGLDATSLQDLLDFAMRAAAITCSRRGADLPRRAELR